MLLPPPAAEPNFIVSKSPNLNPLPIFPSSLVSPSTPCSSSIAFSLTITNLPFLCPAFSPHSRNPHFVLSHHNDDDDDDDENEDEQVIGDCLVFEDGIFEDPFLQQDLYPHSSSKPTTDPEIEPQNLIPDEWGQVVQEINLTKKERRKIAQELEFGQRIENRKRPKNVNLEEYLKVKNEKLSQLNPLVLDNPSGFPSKEGENVRDGDEVDLKEGREVSNSNSNSRVEPKNPRWAVYGRGLDDITDFFNSGNYHPKDDKRQGRQKLFTKEEKFLMNAKVPKLAAATSQKWLPLHTLAASGEFHLMNMLLKHDVDINAADQDGLTALHKAIISKKHAITNYLLRESANPFVRDKDGASLMHCAVRTASSQAIKTLLLHNVDVNLQDNDGWTPLHLAVQSQRTDVVRLLLMKGADKTLKNQDGLTPLELCLYSGRDAKSCGLIKLLKELPRQHRR